MDTEFALKLCNLNNRFYAQQAESFSNTRHFPWMGWERCLYAVSDAMVEAFDPEDDLDFNSWAERPAGNGEPFKIVDLACGNLRFENFWSQRNWNFKALALDACDALPVNRADTQFCHCNIITELAEGTLGKTLETCGATHANLAVCFGFMHHIPLSAWRSQLIRAMLYALEPGCCACISFWRFMTDEGLAARAVETHEEGCAVLQLDRAQFNEGDYLLGWKKTPGVYRYCHSFTTAEIDELIAALPANAKVAARFKADGRTGELNEFLVLQKL